MLLLLLAGCSFRPSMRPYDEKGLTGTTSAPTSLKALARVELARDIKGRATVLVKSPDKIRIEVYGPMNRIVAVVAGDSEDCTLYYRGRLSGCRWDDPALAGPAGPRELVPILLGTGGAVFGDKKGWTTTTDRDGNPAEIVRLGSPELRISMGDYRTVMGAKIPFIFVIENGTKKLNIRYYSVVLNPRLDGDTFSLFLPDYGEEIGP